MSGDQLAIAAILVGLVLSVFNGVRISVKAQ